MITVYCYDDKKLWNKSWVRTSATLQKLDENNGTLDNRKKISELKLKGALAQVYFSGPKIYSDKFG